METAPIRVLLVGDEPADVEFVRRNLSTGIQTPFEVCHAHQLADACEHLRAGQFDVMLLDLGLPAYCDLEALQESRGMNREIPIVVLAGLRSEKTALAALAQGAQDYLVKGSLTADSLARSIHFAIQRQQLMAARVERELALEARAELAAIVEFSDDAIIGETLDGCITSWNQGAEKMYGYSVEEVLGRNVSFLFPPELAVCFAQIRAAVRQGEPCRNFDTDFVRKDGQPVEISLSVSPIKDQQGKVIGISKIGRDIRERKRVEQALRKSQQRLEWAVGGSTDGLGDWSLLTNEANWSPRLREILGFGGDAADEFENSFDAIISRMHPDDRDHVVAEISAGAAQHKAVQSEFRVRTRSGEYLWVLGRGKAIYDDEGKPYHFAGTLTDISERKKLEAELAQRDEQLRQSHKLEAVGSLAGPVASPTSSITCYRPFAGIPSTPWKACRRTKIVTTIWSKSSRRRTGRRR
jgi:PAS domain S-box-containing protein